MGRFGRVLLFESDSRLIGFGFATSDLSSNSPVCPLDGDVVQLRVAMSRLAVTKTTADPKTLYS